MASLATVLMFCLFASTQTAPAASPFTPIDFLVGRWTGTATGEPGNGTVERTYTRILAGKFLEARNRSTYPPQEKNPKGETHEDIGVFSFDRARKQLILRQFHTEGFVNHYHYEATTTTDAIVFVSDAIENIPAGYRARETYRRLGPDEFEEIFEIAEPGKDFAVYSRATLKRVK